MPSVLSDVFALAVKIPLSFIPAFTWAVVTWAALGVYQVLGFKLLPADYIIAPILLTYIMYLAWKRDSWGGLGGAALGTVLSLTGGLLFSEVLGNAVGLFAQWLWTVFTSTITGLVSLFLLVFAFGMSIGFAAVFAPFSLALALAISAVQAFMIYAWLSYFQGLLLTSAYRAVHRLTHDAPPGVHVLAGIGAAATLGALDAYASIAFALTVAVYTVGLWVGVAAGLALAGFLAFEGAGGVIALLADIIMKGVAIAAAKIEDMGIAAGFFSMVVFHLVGIASVGLAWLAAVSLIFSRRLGHRAYAAMASAMLAAVAAQWLAAGV